MFLMCCLIWWWDTTPPIPKSMSLILLIVLERVVIGNKFIVDYNNLKPTIFHQVQQTAPNWKPSCSVCHLSTGMHHVSFLICCCSVLYFGQYMGRVSCKCSFCLFYQQGSSHPIWIVGFLFLLLISLPEFYANDSELWVLLPIYPFHFWVQGWKLGGVICNTCTFCLFIQHFSLST